ncbi:MAG: signal recognition particle subunit SRP19/SEC65 family protein [Promethearchaeota archaeon]
MRNKKKIMIYPCYFDAKRSRRMGRRVSRPNAVVKPLLDELRIICDHMKLKYELDAGASHPAAWWEDNSGRVLVKKKQPDGTEVTKASLVKKMAKYLVAIKKKKKEKEKSAKKKSRYSKTQKTRERKWK